MVPVEGDLRPWPPAGGETSVGPPGRHLAVIAMIEVTAATLAAHPFLHGMPPEHLAMLEIGDLPVSVSSETVCSARP